VVFVNSIFASTLVAACVFSFSVAQAASVIPGLDQIKGNLPVNDDQHFVSPDGTFSLKSGEQLLVSKSLQQWSATQPVALLQ
jgi:hypothetical protein